MTLYNAQINKMYRIVRITAQDNSARRLTDIGFTRGSLVYVSGSAPFGGAVLVALRGALVALREDAAASIEVEAAGDGV